MIVCGCFAVGSASVHVALAGPKALAAHRAAHARLAGVDPERPEADGFAVGEAHRLLSVLSFVIVATGWGKGKDSTLPKPAFDVHQRIYGVHLLAHAARRARTKAACGLQLGFEARLGVWKQVSHQALFYQ